MKVRIKLTAPLSHGAFGPSTGNTMPLRRFPLLLDGEVLDVPALSGNALRGRMRRLLFRDLLTRLWPEEAGRPVPGLWDRIYGATANGGVLDGSDTTVDPGRIRAVREAVPPLSVFGAALWKWFLAGRMSVGIGWPVCDATVAAGVVGTDLEPPPKLPKLAEIESEVSHSRLPDREHSTSVKPMPHSFEALAAGVVLESDVLFDPLTTEVERAAVCWALNNVETLGGRGASGMGRVQVTRDWGDAEAYRAWLADADAMDRARRTLIELAS